MELETVQLVSNEVSDSLNTPDEVEHILKATAHPRSIAPPARTVFGEDLIVPEGIAGIKHDDESMEDSIPSETSQTTMLIPDDVEERMRMLFDDLNKEREALTGHGLSKSEEFLHGEMPSPTTTSYSAASSSSSLAEAIFNSMGNNMTSNNNPELTDSDLELLGSQGRLFEGLIPTYNDLPGHGRLSPGEIRFSGNRSVENVDISRSGSLFDLYEAITAMPEIVCPEVAEARQAWMRPHGGWTRSLSTSELEYTETSMLPRSCLSTDCIPMYGGMGERTQSQDSITYIFMSHARSLDRMGLNEEQDEYARYSMSRPTSEPTCAEQLSGKPRAELVRKCVPLERSVSEELMNEDRQSVKGILRQRSASFDDASMDNLDVHLTAEDLFAGETEPDMRRAIQGLQIDSAKFNVNSDSSLLWKDDVSSSEGEPETPRIRITSETGIQTSDSLEDLYIQEKLFSAATSSRPLGADQQDLQEDSEIPITPETLHSAVLQRPMTEQTSAVLHGTNSVLDNIRRAKEILSMAASGPAASVGSIPISGNRHTEEKVVNQKMFPYSTHNSVVGYDCANASTQSDMEIPASIQDLAMVGQDIDHAISQIVTQSQIISLPEGENTESDLSTMAISLRGSVTDTTHQPAFVGTVREKQSESSEKWDYVAAVQEPVDNRSLSLSCITHTTASPSDLQVGDHLNLSDEVFQDPQIQMRSTDTQTDRDSSVMATQTSAQPEITQMADEKSPSSVSSNHNIGTNLHQIATHTTDRDGEHVNDLPRLVETGVNPSPPRAESPDIINTSVITSSEQASDILNTSIHTSSSYDSHSIGLQTGSSFISLDDMSFSSDEEYIPSHQNESIQPEMMHPLNQRLPYQKQGFTHEVPHYVFEDPGLAALREEHARFMDALRKAKVEREERLAKRKEMKHTRNSAMIDTDLQYNGSLKGRDVNEDGSSPFASTEASLHDSSALSSRIDTPLGSVSETELQPEGTCLTDANEFYTNSQLGTNDVLDASHSVCTSTDSLSSTEGAGSIQHQVSEVVIEEHIRPVEVQRNRPYHKEDLGQLLSSKALLVEEPTISKEYLAHMSYRTGETPVSSSEDISEDSIALPLADDNTPHVDVASPFPFDDDLAGHGTGSHVTTNNLQWLASQSPDGMTSTDTEDSTQIRPISNVHGSVVCETVPPVEIAYYPAAPDHNEHNSFSEDTERSKLHTKSDGGHETQSAMLELEEIQRIRELLNRPTSRTSATQYDSPMDISTTSSKNKPSSCAASTQYEESFLSPIKSSLLDSCDRERDMNTSMDSATSSRGRLSDVDAIIEKYATIKKLIEGEDSKPTTTESGTVIDDLDTIADNIHLSSQASKKQNEISVPVDTITNSLEYGRDNRPINISISLHTPDFNTSGHSERGVSPAPSEMVDEAIGTDFPSFEYDDELERLRRERQRILDMLAKDLMPSKLQVELAEAQLNYIIGQTDTLLNAIDEPYDWDPSVVMKLARPEDHLSSISKDYLIQYRSTLEQSKIHIEERIQRLEKEKDNSKKAYLGGKNLAQMRRSAAREAFKIERQREQATYSTQRNLPPSTSPTGRGRPRSTQPSHREFKDSQYTPLSAEFMTPKERAHHLTNLRKGIVAKTKQEERTRSLSPTSSTTSSNPQRSLSAGHPRIDLDSYKYYDIYSITSGLASPYSFRNSGVEYKSSSDQKHRSQSDSRITATQSRYQPLGDYDSPDTSMDENTQKLLGEYQRTREELHDELERAKTCLEKKPKHPTPKPQPKNRPSLQTGSHTFVDNYVPSPRTPYDPRLASSTPNREYNRKLEQPPRPSGAQKEIDKEIEELKQRYAAMSEQMDEPSSRSPSSVTDRYSSRYDSVYEPRYDALSRTSPRESYNSGYTGYLSVGSASSLYTSNHGSFSYSSSDRYLPSYSDRTPHTHVGPYHDGSVLSRHYHSRERTPSTFFDSSRPVNAMDIKSRIDRDRSLSRPGGRHVEDGGLLNKWH